MKKIPTMAPVRVFTAAEKRDLTGQSFRKVTLDAIDFSGANLIEASFDGCSLRDADFTKADLRGADLTRCDLRGAKLDDVVLGGNRFHGSCLAGATGLTEEQVDYVGRRGGTFIDGPGDSPPRLRLIK